jgi:hypothetical protein
LRSGRRAIESAQALGLGVDGGLFSCGFALLFFDHAL